MSDFGLKPLQECAAEVLKHVLLPEMETSAFPLAPPMSILPLIDISSSHEFSLFLFCVTALEASKVMALGVSTTEGSGNSMQILYPVLVLRVCKTIRLQSI